jgi:hypothetical protein
MLNGYKSFQINKPGLMNKNPDFSNLKTFFGWIQPDVFKNKFENTTQYARMPTATVFEEIFYMTQPCL